MIDTLALPTSMKRSLSDIAHDEMNFFFAAPVHNELNVNEAEFDFFPSTGSPSHHDSDETLSFSADSHSMIGDSPPPSTLKNAVVDENTVAGSPQMTTLDTSVPFKPHFVEVTKPVQQAVAPQVVDSKPKIELPSCVHGEVGVTAPLDTGALGIRCTTETFGESFEIGESGIRTVWYCDRPFPRFDAQLFDKLTGLPVEPVDEDGNPWTLQITIRDGFGADASDKVYGNLATREFPIGENGVAPIAGLRFSSVSSKAGGSFHLSIGLKSPHPAASLVSEWHSDPLQVLSYRLFHAPKVAFENLRAHDSVGKMKGIGSLYAKRFAAIGVRRIIDLAHVDLSDSSATGTERVHMILNALRKDRGAMTMAKLGEYINQAREIVERDTSVPEETKVVATQSMFDSPTSYMGIVAPATANFMASFNPENGSGKRRRTALSL